MVLEEFKGYWKSKFNLVLALALFLMVAIATRGGYAEKQEFVGYLDNAIAQYGLPDSDGIIVGDADIEHLTMVVDGWTGIYLFERLFFVDSDYMMMFWMVCMIGMGVHIGGKTFSTLQSSFGTMIMTRMPYRDYLRKILLAQALYMATFLGAVFLIVFMSQALFGGWGLQVPFLSRVLDVPIVFYLLILLLFVAYSIICMMALILIASLSPVFLKNKYVIQFLPICVLLGSYILAFVFGNMNQVFAFLTVQFVFQRSLMALTDVFSRFAHRALIQTAIEAVSYPLLLLVALVVLYLKNMRKFGKDYLL